MAWIALNFYWFDSIYQWLTSDPTGWPRGGFLKNFEEGGFLKSLRLLFGQIFPQTTIVSQRKQYEVRFSLIFCFASVDSIKALTNCLEKLEILAKRFGL